MQPEKFLSSPNTNEGVYGGQFHDNDEIRTSAAFTGVAQKARLRAKSVLGVGQLVVVDIGQSDAGHHAMAAASVQRHQRLLRMVGVVLLLVGVVLLLVGVVQVVPPDRSNGKGITSIPRLYAIF